jgi:hypothetical protein
MNFIKHFLGWIEKVSEDQRITPHHMSLYITLFQYWNLNHFRNPISICRQEVMDISKIGSTNTYLKCLKELDAWNYIRYEPSFNAQRGSKVHLFRFDKGTDNAEQQSTDRAIAQEERPSINELNNQNLSKTEKGLSPSKELATDFFISKKSNEREALKFFNHFQSNGWLVGGRSPMRDWQAAATKWILNANNFTNAREITPAKLSTTTDKNYGEPL